MLLYIYQKHSLHSATTVSCTMHCLAKDPNISVHPNPGFMLPLIWQLTLSSTAAASRSLVWVSLYMAMQWCTKPCHQRTSLVINHPQCQAAGAVPACRVTGMRCVCLQMSSRRGALEVHEFQGTFKGQPANFKMTSVIGHV